tara:strand:+ start:428 stop:730 length:303 start_codon:yes stop_codon:yes gene_type:complete
MADWKKEAKYYSINIVFNQSMVSYYNERKEIVNSEMGKDIDSELEKSLKRLYRKDLNPDNGKSKHNKKLKIAKDAGLQKQKSNTGGKRIQKQQPKPKRNK